MCRNIVPTHADVLPSYDQQCIDVQYITDHMKIIVSYLIWTMISVLYTYFSCTTPNSLFPSSAGARCDVATPSNMTSDMEWEYVEREASAFPMAGRRGGEEERRRGDKERRRG